MVKKQNNEFEQNSISTDEVRVEQSGIETNSLQKDSLDIIQTIDKRGENDPQFRTKSKKKVKLLLSYLMISLYCVCCLYLVSGNRYSIP